MEAGSDNGNNGATISSTSYPVQSPQNVTETCSTNDSSLDSSISANTAHDKTSTVKKGKQIKKTNLRAVKRTAQPENAMDSTSSNTAARSISTAPPEKVSRKRTKKQKTIGAVGPAGVSAGPSTQKYDFLNIIKTRLNKNVSKN